MSSPDPITFDELAGKALRSIGEFLDNPEPDKSALITARIASSVVSSWTRHKQTEGAREATTFMMAREIARDQEELRRYVQATAPDSPLVNALISAPAQGDAAAAILAKYDAE